eukprot:TRINITY_DN2646_c0_g1_i1.p1 TRINITY_DN2646_c0_g1~~TRINITY_DN2646_c0_g1_i1.p1  ORF type:complete len:953 (-),score=274.91 TRINITY_DN2646_c0_g1_i1:128-2986(-)
MEEAPHLQTVEEVADQLKTSVTTGLSSDEAKKRLQEFGPNQFETEGGRTWYGIFAEQLFNYMNGVLVIAMALAFSVLSWIDAGVVAFVIMANALIGFSQEWKSEKTMNALRKMSTPSSLVIRDGKEEQVDSSTLVRGDVIIVQQGDSVPADCRVIETIELETDEAMLTGESTHVKKTTAKIVHDGDDVGVGDRKNMMFMSTGVTKGKGKAIVSFTGNSTQIGKIAKKLLKSKTSKTPLQIRIDRLGFVLCGVAVVCIGLVLLTGWAWGTFQVYPEGLRVAVSVAVAVIPQSIVVVVTLILTVGVKSMAKNNALVRKLNAIETLGNVMHICSDKTGTLTQGKMMATSIRLLDGSIYNISGEGINPEGSIRDEFDTIVDPKGLPQLCQAITIASLCNMSFLSQKTDEAEKVEWIGNGSPTEVALVVLGMKTGLSKEEQKGKYTFVCEYPFNSTIKMMSTVYEDNGSKVLFTKGAPERAIDLCTSKLTDGMNASPFTPEDREAVTRFNLEMASEGLRVLALCFRDLGDTEIDPERSTMERDCTFVGLVGVRDPPRDGVPEAVQMCHRAGIIVHMVTGDHQFTAKAIATQIGIIPSHLSPEQVDSLVMTANAFDQLTDEQLQGLKVLPLVIARCSPDSKVRMVQEIQRRGRRVAMLGDGVNDSPAIKLADVGVAMGLNGSDVTKEASDVILMDDNFNTIVVAVKEGRKIFANIRRSVIHLLCGNLAEAIIIVCGVAFSLRPPLTPMEILWINLITSAPPAFVLGTTPEKAWFMQKEKRSVDEKFFNLETVVDILFWGPLIGALSLVNFVIANFVFRQSLDKCQASCFTALTLMLMFHAYNCRDLRGPFFMKGFARFYWLHVAVLFGIGSLFFTFYTPVFETSVFEHSRPDWRNWLVALASAVVFMASSEVYKLIKRPIRKRSFNKKSEKTADESVIESPRQVEKSQVEQEMKSLAT